MWLSPHVMLININKQRTFSSACEDTNLQKWLKEYLYFTFQIITTFIQSYMT